MSKKKQEATARQAAQRKSRAEERARAQRRNRAVWIAVAVIILLGIFSVSYFTSSTFYRQVTAATVGNHKLSVADFNFYYQNAFSTIYNSLAQQYGDEVSSIVDTSKPLSQQYYSADQTWEDYITEVAVANINQVFTLYDAAKEAGFSLTEEDVTEINDTLDSIKANAESNSLDVDVYLSMVFGRGMNEKIYRRNTEKTYLAQSYSVYLRSTYEFTEEELEAFYAEDPSNFDTIDFRIFYFDGGDSEDQEPGDGFIEAEEKANAMADAIETEEDFIALAYEYAPEDNKAAYEKDAATLYRGLKKSDATLEAMADWLFDDVRVYGDKTAVLGDTGYYVLFFVSRSDNRYELQSMRHILTKPDSLDEHDHEGEGEDGEIDHEAELKAQALVNTELIYEEWKSGEMTEDSFAELANMYSMDGDGTSGGYYGDIFYGQMVIEVNDWLFDPAREYGDTEIVETIFGYHILFYTGTTGNYWESLVRKALEADTYKKWFEKGLEKHEVVLKKMGLDMAR